MVGRKLSILLAIIVAVMVILSVGRYFRYRELADAEAYHIQLMHLDTMFGRHTRPCTAIDLNGVVHRIPDGSADICLLLFFTPDCPACIPALEEAERLQTAFSRQHMKVLAMSSASRQSLISFSEKQSILVPICPITDRVEREFGIVGSPIFIILDRNGSVAFAQAGLTEQHNVLRVEQKLALLLSVVPRFGLDGVRPVVESRSPELFLQGANGHRIRLKSFDHSTCLVVFVSPGCTACTDMLAPLDPLLSNPGERSHSVLVAIAVSDAKHAVTFMSGSNLSECALRSGQLTVAFDPGGVTRRSFPAPKVPAVALIGKTGKLVAFADNVAAARRIIESFRTTGGKPM